MSAQEDFNIPDGYMQDHTGALIPLANINEIDIYRDEVVKEIVKKAKAMQKVLAEGKADMDKAFDVFVEQSVSKYDAKRPGGTKGNLTLQSFDGKYKVLKQVQERLDFDERLNAAKTLIDECLTEWMDEGTNNNLRTIINSAFKVGKDGRPNINAILGLRRHKIKDQKWLVAMQAISDSLQVLDSKAYFRVYERNAKGDYDHISLDIAAL